MGRSTSSTASEVAEPNEQRNGALIDHSRDDWVLAPVDRSQDARAVGDAKQAASAMCGGQGVPAERSLLIKCAYDDALHRQIDVLENRAAEALRERELVEGQRAQVADRSARRHEERQAQLREHTNFL